MSETPSNPKPKKVFSWDNYHQRQIAVQIAYIGWDLDGFVQQPHSQKTVEYHLFEAFKKAKLIQDPQDCNYSLCGRTDAGVSGAANVISIRVRSICPTGVGAIVKEGAPIKEEELNYIQILNGILPAEIRAIGLSYVPLDFSARFACKSRCYRYFFHIERKNIDLMMSAANALLGEHDFRSFCKFSPSATTHCVRVINSIIFGNAGLGVWYFEIKGSGFIWHQIRCIASVLFAVGDRLEDVSIVEELLDIKKYPGRPLYRIADPDPLIFWGADYEGVEWRIDDAVRQKVVSNFAQFVRRLEIRAAVCRCFLGADGLPDVDRKSYTPIAKLQRGKSVEQLIEEYSKGKTQDEGAIDE